jgi:hypothetical protein
LIIVEYTYLHVATFLLIFIYQNNNKAAILASSRTALYLTGLHKYGKEKTAGNENYNLITSN